MSNSKLEVRPYTNMQGYLSTSLHCLLPPIYTLTDDLIFYAENSIPLMGVIIVEYWDRKSPQTEKYLVHALQPEYAMSLWSGAHRKLPINYSNRLADRSATGIIVELSKEEQKEPLKHFLRLHHVAEEIIERLFNAFQPDPRQVVP